MIKVINEVPIYEIDGKEERGLPTPKLYVQSHWNQTGLVVLRSPDGMQITVSAGDLEAAIKNATNSRRMS